MKTTSSLISRWLAAAGLVLLVLIVLMIQPAHAQDGPIMQGFYWNTHPGDVTDTQGGGVWWDSLTTVASELAGAGFGTVWTPPAQKGFAGLYDMGYGLYDYYDLGGYDQKGTLRTRHGNRTQLDAMIQALHAEGLSVMADVVLNHRAGAEAQQLEACDDGDGRQLRYTEFRPVSGRLPADAVNFHPTDFPGHCNLDGPFHDRTFFEDLDYFYGIDQTPPPGGWYAGPHNLGVMGDSLIAWGRWLLDDIGFDEVRLDAVKHIEPGFLAPFLAELGASEQPFAVGELFDGNSGAVAGYQHDVERFNLTYGAGTRDAEMAVFDFPLRYALRDMANDTGGGFDMWNLNFRGLRFEQGLAGEDIVTFVENHDTDRIGYVVVSCSDPHQVQQGSTCLAFSTDHGHDPVVTDKHMAYGYLMAAEGRPSVFWKDWFWYGLDEELRWQMALRADFAKGSATPIHDLNPYFTQGHGGDLFVMNRQGSNTGRDGLVLALNDNASSEAAAYVNTLYQNVELKDYSDAYLFVSTRAFDDTRALVRAGARNYAWYAPTGLYPQPPDEAPSSFVLGDHVGAKQHYVVLRAEDTVNFVVGGAPIQPGDEVAILNATGSDAVGLGRIGQSFRWDGEHDMLIEVLGGDDEAEARGGLLNGEPLRLAVFDGSTGQMKEATQVTFAPDGTNFSFSADRPASRGGSTPFALTVNNGSGTYSVGSISLVTAFDATTDTDEDGVADAADNCPVLANADQANFDGDGEGDACDADDDNDGVVDAKDAFPLDASEQLDTDGDGVGNNADPDDDGDELPDDTDRLPLVPDTTAPTIALVGANPLVLTCRATYEEPGYAVEDDQDPNPEVAAEGTVESQPGAYTITYAASDASGNTAAAERTVVVEDAAPPEVDAGLEPIADEAGRFVVHCTATDACGADPAVASVMAVPGEAASFEVRYNSNPRRKVIVNTKRGFVHVHGPDPEVFWQEVVAQGGMSVDEGQVLRLAASEGKGSPVLHFHFDKGGQLEAINGPRSLIRLVCAATDDAGNRTTVEATLDGTSAPVYASAAATSAAGAGADEGLETAARAGLDEQPAGTAPRPDTYTIEGSYPNPFAERAVIRFGIPEEARVRLAVYDVLGREVDVLLDGPAPAGVHEAVFDGRGLPSGLYVYRLETPTSSLAGRMLLMK